ncbi:MAG TPA: hypothetical protein VKZ78_07025 [Sphingobacteriaceae bacterium]|nr:hypothetical protein [Sphingobacteriaceae bacterium]
MHPQSSQVFERDDHIGMAKQLLQQVQVFGLFIYIDCCRVPE